MVVYTEINSNVIKNVIGYCLNISMVVLAKSYMKTLSAHVYGAALNIHRNKKHEMSSTFRELPTYLETWPIDTHGQSHQKKMDDFMLLSGSSAPFCGFARPYFLASFALENVRHTIVLKSYEGELIPTHGDSCCSVSAGLRRTAVYNSRASKERRD